MISTVFAFVLTSKHRFIAKIVTFYQQSILKIFHPLATLAPARVIQRILTPRILLVGWLNDSSSNLVN
jgi:F0F1-type ATP synthase assembly protein I